MIGPGGIVHLFQTMVFNFGSKLLILGVLLKNFKVQTPKKLQMFLHGQVELIVDWRKGVEK